MKLAFTFILMSIMSNVLSQFVPNAPKDSSFFLVEHGQKRYDPYYWMNKRDDQKVLKYIEEENNYSKKYFENTKSIQSKLITEFESRTDLNEKGPIRRVNGLDYQWQSKEGKDYRTLVQLKDGKEIVILDENLRAEGKPFYQLGGFGFSENNQLLAIAEDFIGRRAYDIHFIDQKNGKTLSETIKNTDGGFVWAPDNKTIFYSTRDETTLRSNKIFRHVLGTKQASDELLYEEKDEEFSVYLSKTSDKKYIMINKSSTLSSEIWYLDASTPLKTFQVFLPKIDNVVYEVDHCLEGFLIYTNLDAKNYQLRISKDFPNSMDATEVLIAHNETVFLSGFKGMKDYLVIEKNVRGQNQIEVLYWGKQEGKIFPVKEEVYSLGLAYTEDVLGSYINIIYTSPTTPSQIMSLNLDNFETKIVWKQNVMDEKFSSSNYETKRIWAKAADGTEIPVCIVYKRGIDLKTAPILVYGYGSYGYTIPDYFNESNLSLLDRGFVYANVHVRGSKYLGEQWYLDGKFLAKKNTFTDFIDASNYLAENGFCNPKAMYAEGGSAGGLLMGAVVNLAPKRFRGVIAQVPFVDVVSTMMDSSIPLTTGEYQEWGNPNDKVYYDYMLSYSPYDNVRKQKYPAMLITTGYHDSQVQYWEPLKWIAKLRDENEGSLPILLDCNMDSGHGGGSGRSTEWIEKAKEFAFILNEQGITN